MGRKRKLAPKSAQSVEPPLKQQQQEQQHDLQKQPQFEPDQDNGAEYEEVEVEEEVEEVEEVEEEEEEEEEEVEQEEEDNDPEEEEGDEEADDYDKHVPQNVNHNTAKAPSTSSANQGNDGGGGDDDDDEPIQKLLEPFSKEQIVTLLSEAANKHRDVADRIRKVADGDPVHRKIFVHGLGWDTNAETLINAFRQYGEIEDCKAVCDKVSGKSKGYGFILFKTRRGASNALKQPQKKIGNRMTACQLASIGPVQPGAVVAQPASAAPPASEYTQKKIYVSNVGADLDPQKLLAFFSRYGEIEEGPLGLDKVTGKPRGFCLFVYKNSESAKRALEEPHKDFEGYILHCQKAIDGPKPGKNQQQQNPQRTQFQRNENPGFVAGTSTAAPGHLMAPAGPGIGFNQGAAAAQQAALNPALGQALTALLASQGATLGLTNLLGNFASSAAAVNPGVPAAGHGIQSGYNAQPNISTGAIGGYGNQVGLQGAYPNQQMGQGGSGRGQHGGGQYGGVGPYMGH